MLRHARRGRSPLPSRRPLQVCGEGEGVWGDSVVPLHCALLPGANNVILDGVRHR